MAPRGKWASGPPSLGKFNAGDVGNSSPALASNTSGKSSNSAPKLGGAWAARQASGPESATRAGPSPKHPPGRQVGSATAENAAADETSAQVSSADHPATDLTTSDTGDNAAAAAEAVGLAKTQSVSGSSVAASSHSSGHHRHRRRRRHNEQTASEAMVWKPKLNSNTTEDGGSDIDIEKISKEFADLEMADLEMAITASMDPEALMSSLKTVPIKAWSDISAWLRELKLQQFAGDVLDWCEQMGVCCLEEVVEGAEDGEFVEFLGQLGAEVSCLENEARAVQQLVQARAAEDRQSSLVSLPTQTTLSTTMDPSPLLSTSRPGLLSPKSSNLSETMWPNIRHGSERQGKKKKERRLSTGEFVPQGRRDNQHSEEAAKALRRAAVEKLEQQLRKEEEQRTAASLAQLTESLECPCPEALKRSISDAEQLQRTISCSTLRRSISDSVGQAREKLEHKVRRHQQRCVEAVCALQAAVEAPRDDKFGQVVHEALLGSADALQANGGSEALEEAKAALCLWEELQIALHLALRRGYPEALDLAVEEARKCNLPPQHSLLADAQRALSTM